MSKLPSPDQEASSSKAKRYNHLLTKTESSEFDRPLTGLFNDLLAFMLCLLAAHYVMIYAMNLRPIAMNSVYMIIALTFGFDFYVSTQGKTVLALLIGFVIGLLSVLAMSAIVWFVDGYPFFGDRRARLDVIESSAAVMFAYAAGNALGAALHQLLPTAFAAGSRSFALTVKHLVLSLGPGSGNRSRDIIDLTKSLTQALTALILAVGALWVAIKGLFAGS